MTLYSKGTRALTYENLCVCVCAGSQPLTVDWTAEGLYVYRRKGRGRADAESEGAGQGKGGARQEAAIVEIALAEY